VARGGPTPRGIEADPAEGGRWGASGPGPTPERAGRRQSGGEGPSLPLLSPQVTFRGGRAPPQIHGGGGRRAEGRMPDPSGPGWALGANKHPAVPHDTDRPIETSAGTWNLRRPGRGGRPSSGLVAHGGHDVRQPEAPDGPWTRICLVAIRMPRVFEWRADRLQGWWFIASAEGRWRLGLDSVREQPLDIDRPIAGRMTLPADRPPAHKPGVGREWHATFAGPGVHRAWEGAGRSRTGRGRGLRLGVPASAVFGIRRHTRRDRRRLVDRRIAWSRPPSSRLAASPWSRVAYCLIAGSTRNCRQLNTGT